RGGQKENSCQSPLPTLSPEGRGLSSESPLYLRQIVRRVDVAQHSGGRIKQPRALQQRPGAAVAGETTGEVEQRAVQQRRDAGAPVALARRGWGRSGGEVAQIAGTDQRHVGEEDEERLCFAVDRGPGGNRQRGAEAFVRPRVDQHGPAGGE